MKRIIVYFVFALIFITFCVHHAFACTCLTLTSPCGSFQATPIVFVGLVKSIDEEMIDIVRFGKQEKIRNGLTAHFIIEEPLKGIEGGEVDLVTGGGGGDCGYPFKAGERYLVYAYRTQGEALESSASRTVFGSGRFPKKNNSITTSICSRTRPLSYAQDDLDLIHAMLKGKAENRIFGMVDEYFSTFGESATSKGTYKPKAGLLIKAEGGAGKYQALTDAEGRFRLNNLNPGNYKVRLILPSTYGMQFSFEKIEYGLKVEKGCWGAELSFTVAINGRISGRVFDASGKPVGEQVQVSIIRADSVGKGMTGLEYRNEYTDKQGRYEFYGVPAGRFVLGVNIADVPDKGTPYSTTYYPSSATYTQQAVIELAAGEKRDGLDFHLPPRLEEKVIAGIVLKTDGTTAAEAKVVLYDLENPDKDVFGMDAETDAQGRFSVKIYQSRRYLLRAYLSENYFVGTGAQSEMLEVNATDTVTPIKIILNKPGIFRDQKQ